MEILRIAQQKLASPSTVHKSRESAGFAISHFLNGAGHALERSTAIINMLRRAVGTLPECTSARLFFDGGPHACLVSRARWIFLEGALFAVAPSPKYRSHFPLPYCLVEGIQNDGGSPHGCAVFCGSADTTG